MTASYEGIMFGVAPNLYPIEAIYEAADLAEKYNIDGVMVADHVVAFGVRRFDALDAWTVLGALAIRTKKVKLGTCVSDPHRKHPETLAQIVTTVDHISNGRTILGVGAGESMNLNPYGVEWDHPVTRMKEAIEIIKKLWTEDVVNYDGKYYHFRNAIMQPKPIQKPHPPIWIGANSPRTMKMTAEMGDGWLPVIRNPEQYRMSLELIKKWAKDKGRDPEEITPAIFLYTGTAKDEETVREMFGIPIKVDLASSPIFMRSIGLEPLGPEFNRMRFPFLPPEERRKKMEELIRRASEIPDEEVTKRFIVGTPDKCIEGIERLIAAGAKYFLIVPYVSARRFNEAFKVYAEEVVSYFKS